MRIEGEFIITIITEMEDDQLMVGYSIDSTVDISDAAYVDLLRQLADDIESARFWSD